MHYKNPGNADYRSIHDEVRKEMAAPRFTKSAKIAQQKLDVPQIPHLKAKPHRLAAQ
jgi:hypothetical protein